MSVCLSVSHFPLLSPATPSAVRKGTLSGREGVKSSSQKTSHLKSFVVVGGDVDQTLALKVVWGPDDSSSLVRLSPPSKTKTLG